MANTSLVPIGADTSALVAEANVTDELTRSGLALGDLIKRTGASVAETQRVLNATGAATATALATTLVDVIALQEKVHDDQGNLIEITTHVRQLPLINFVDPVFYEWSQVRLQGSFFAREFGHASSYKGSESASSNAQGQSGLLLLFGVGRTAFDSQRTSTTVTEEGRDDVSFGRVRMNSVLRPRTDIGVPKPRQAIQGPRLSVIQGSVTDDIEEGILKGREMSVLIEYRRRDSTPIAGKAISIEADGVAWSFAGAAVTDAQGKVEITLRKDFLDEAADSTPQEHIISARIGIVQNNTTVKF